MCDFIDQAIPRIFTHDDLLYKGVWFGPYMPWYGPAEFSNLWYCKTLKLSTDFRPIDYVSYIVAFSIK